MMTQKKLLEEIAIRVAALPRDRIQRVAIDGVDGAGKTTFADSLAPIVEKLGRKVIRASVDGFHNPKDVRYKNGKGAESFFKDSYNYVKLREALLNPLSPNGTLRYVNAVFDVDKNEPIEINTKTAEGTEILIFDGIFLHRPELKNYWDCSIFLDVSFERSIPRGAQRGSGSPDVHAPSNERYIGGQKIYLSTCQPQKLASIHVDYNDLELPHIIRAN